MDKRHIIAEIKRTAEANAGVPLGRAKFLQETGIKESDWLGRHWVRWNDAIREAGFQPNQMQQPYNENLLIERFVALTRELGRLPSIPEMRLKARSDPSFPNDKTLIGRFGSKQKLVDRAREFCKGRAAYKDLEALFTISPFSEPSVADTRVEASEHFGFVYLIKSGRYYKIGRSNSTGRREYELAIQLPEKALTLHTIKTDDPPGIESYWHRRFERKRKNGEWFELSTDDVAVFKRRKFM